MGFAAGNTSLRHRITAHMSRNERLNLVVLHPQSTGSEDQDQRKNRRGEEDEEEEEEEEVEDV
jgi:hypothetical protein